MQFTDITDRNYERFTHDCSSCIFVAQYVIHDLDFHGTYDLYYCLRKLKTGDIYVSLILREDNRPHEYASMGVFGSEFKTIENKLNNLWLKQDYHLARLMMFIWDKFKIDNPILVAEMENKTFDLY